MCLICCIPRKVYDLLIRGKIKKKRKKIGGKKRKFDMFLQSVTFNFKPLCLVFSMTDIFQGLQHIALIFC